MTDQELGELVGLSAPKPQLRDADAFWRDTLRKARAQRRVARFEKVRRFVPAAAIFAVAVGLGLAIPFRSNPAAQTAKSISVSEGTPILKGTEPFDVEEVAHSTSFIAIEVGEGISGAFQVPDTGADGDSSASILWVVASL